MLSKKPFKIEWFVYAQSLSYVLTLHNSRMPSSGIVQVSFLHRVNFKRSLEILRMSYPFALLILLMSLFNRVDSVMLERLLENGKEEAGIYAQSFRIFDAASQFSLLFAALLLPMFSRMIKLGEECKRPCPYCTPTIDGGWSLLWQSVAIFTERVLSICCISSLRPTAQPSSES